MKNIILYSIAVMAFAFSTNSFSAVTEKQKKDLEIDIKNCEVSYALARNQQQLIENIKKPGESASVAEQTRYENKALYLKAFKQALADFAKLTNEKIKLRGLTNSNDLKDQVGAYKNRCKSSLTGLMGFAVWASTGAAQKGSESIYTGWVNLAKCNKVKC